MAKRKSPAKNASKAAKGTAKRKSTARTPPFAPYPAWSTAKFFGFLRSGLRSAYSKWPPKYEVLNAARVPYEGPDKRTKWLYRCAVTGKLYKSKEVSVDHIVPAGSLNSFEDLPGFVERLFCGPEGLQVLSKEAHDAKTLEERKSKENNK